MKTPPYLDAALSGAERAKDLVARLTPEEKISQMVHAARAIPRLDIPEYNWWNEALHGVARAGIATVFPQAIGLAASWNPPLLHRAAAAISDEARAKHHEAVRRGERGWYQGLTMWSPNINIFRDPRWGRGQETYGEDPHLTARLGVAFARGLQGDNPRYLKVVSTAKHFAVHSGPENNRFSFDSQVVAKDLWETYLPAFEALVTEARVWSVMGAYNRLNGVPCCAERALLEDILRQRWGFKGHVVSDCGAITFIHADHKTAPDAATASAQSVKAGCDLCCGDTYHALGDALARGLLTEADIDRSLTRLFEARMQLGQFDPPEAVPYAQIPISVNDCPEHRRLALEMARESIVLLKNQNNLLPLPRAGGNVAVIGPNADQIDVLLGNYNGLPSRAVTPLQGIRDKIGAERVLHAAGCSLFDEAEAGFPEALAAAQQAEVVIFVGGLSSRLEGEAGDTPFSDAGGDRTRIDLPGGQHKLLQALHATGKPVILVLLHGSALAVNWEQDHLPAIVSAWYPGEEGGAALADVLWGDYNPGGRLPVTFYRSLDQLPDFENYGMENRTYRYFRATPLYPFGFGLSYTRFEYDQLQITPKTIPAGGSVQISVRLRNAGECAGAEVVQIYLTDVQASGRTPLRTLRGFQRLHLKAGEARTVQFTLGPADYRLINDAGAGVIEPGEFRITVGGCQPGYAALHGACTQIVEGTFSVGR